MKLIYVMDPMCAWCYAFGPELEEFISKYSFLEIDYIMGGLAPDNNKPMDEDLKRVISSYWVEIEKKTRVVLIMIIGNLTHLIVQLMLLVVQ